MRREEERTQRRWIAIREGGGDREKQTSFLFFLLFKRSILGVGWNLSVFSCSLLLRSVVYHPFFTIPLLPIVSVWFLVCWSWLVLAMLSVAQVSWCFSLEVRTSVNPQCEGQYQRKVPLPSLIQSPVMDCPCHPLLPPSLPARSAVIQL